MKSKFIRILLVDDDITLVSLLRDLLSEKGYVVDQAVSYYEAEEQMKLFRYQVIISDFKMPEKTGLDLLECCKKTDYDTQFIIVTAFGSIENAVQALKMGAFHYLTKPLQLDELLIVIEKAIQHTHLTFRNEFLKQELRKKEEYFLQTKTAVMNSLYQNIEKLRSVDSTVLLEGETGSGKEVMARLIHNTSIRKNENFVPLNCGALPESILESELFGFEKGAFTGADSAKTGKLEFADGGTLFLDEIEALSPKAQVSLLRFLQEGEISRLGSNKKQKLNVRVIAATKQNLLHLSREGKFREDLYYRLSVFPLMVPPLRERKNDILDMADWLMNKLCVRLVQKKCTFSPEAKQAMLDYHWPGNIRELRNCLERAVIVSQGDIVGEEALFLSTSKNLPVKFDEIGFLSLQDLEASYISWALNKLKGNKKKTAEALGITLRGLYYKLEK